MLECWWDARVPHIHIPITLDKLSQPKLLNTLSLSMSSGEDPKHYKHIQGADKSMTDTNIGGNVCSSE